MQTSYSLPRPSQPYRGLTIVVLLHVVFAWALISGTAREGLTLLIKPLQANLLQEAADQPKPPPPPPKTAKPLASKLETPPPPFIPPAEVPVSETAVSQIETSTQPPEMPPPMAPVQPSVVQAPSVMTPTDISTACPIQVPPEMPRRAIIDGTQGVIKAQAMIQDGVVREVIILSGPRIFYAAVRNAMLQYKCTSATGVVVASQEFNFRLQ